MRRIILTLLVGLAGSANADCNNPDFKAAAATLRKARLDIMDAKNYPSRTPEEALAKMRQLGNFEVNLDIDAMVKKDLIYIPMLSIKPQLDRLDCGEVSNPRQTADDIAKSFKSIADRLSRVIQVAEGLKLTSSAEEEDIRQMYVAAANSFASYKDSYISVRLLEAEQQLLNMCDSAPIPYMANGQTSKLIGCRPLSKSAKKVDGKCQHDFSCSNDSASCGSSFAVSQLIYTASCSDKDAKLCGDWRACANQVNSSGGVIEKRSADAIE